MKGIFTQIKYRAQGVILREAKLTGMVVGIPIVTEHRKQISIEAAADYTAASATAQPVIAIKGQNPAFTYVDQDVLYENGFRMWIRKSSEAKEDVVELLSAGAALDPASESYNVDETMVSVNPVRNRAQGTYTATVTEAVSHVATITFSGLIPDIAAGDTISSSVDNVIGKIGTPRVEGGVTVAPVTWGPVGYEVDAGAGALDAGYKLYYDYSADPITAAPRGYVMYFDSIVYRPSVYGVHTITTVDDLIDLFNENSLVNPLSNLASGAYFYTAANGFDSQFKICALDIRSESSLATTAPRDLLDSLTLWSAATSKVDMHKDVYYLTTMTDSASIQSAWEAYVNTSSAMARQREKRYWVARDIINGGDVDRNGVDINSDIVGTFGNGYYGEKYYEAGLKYEDGYYPGGIATEGGAATLTDSNRAAWVANALTGATIEITNGVGAGQTRTVLSNTGTVITVTENWDAVPNATSKYRIYKPAYFDKDADVEAAQATPMATNNERVTYIGCEWATIDETNIEGYHVAAIIAGWRASLPLGYVADDMKVPLITSIPSRSGYYSEDDLDALSAAGWYMLNQELDNSPVTCYIQKTTAYDSVEKGEESFIVALDSAMRDIRETLAPYIRGGLDNRISVDATAPVTVRYLAKLNAAISTVRYKYMQQQEVFSAMDVIAVRVSTISRTAAEIEVKFSHYYPAREIYVTGYVE